MDDQRGWRVRRRRHAAGAIANRVGDCRWAPGGTVDGLLSKGAVVDPQVLLVLRVLQVLRAMVLYWFEDRRCSPGSRLPNLRSCRTVLVLPRFWRQRTFVK